MPTFSTGKAAVFSIDDTSGTSRVISDVLNTIDFPESTDTAETTAFGAASRSYIVSLESATTCIAVVRVQAGSHIRRRDLRR